MDQDIIDEMNKTIVAIGTHQAEQIEIAATMIEGMNRLDEGLTIPEIVSRMRDMAARMKRELRKR